MKKMLSVLLVVAMAFSLVACGGKNSDSSNSGDSSSTIASNTKNEASALSSAETTNDTTGNGKEVIKAGKRVLVAYFSATGTTKKIASYVADSLAAEVYEIVPAEPYTQDDLNYNSDCRANSEMNDENARPKIDGSIENMADYDIVFIGYPIWWGKAAKITSTFVESYDFTGKTVVTFCTSGSSPNNDSAIKALASGANWISGKRFSGDASKSDIAKWINSLDLDLKAKP